MQMSIDLLNAAFSFKHLLVTCFRSDDLMQYSIFDHFLRSKFNVAHFSGLLHAINCCVYNSFSFDLYRSV